MNSAAEIMSYAYADAFPKGLFPFRCLVPLAATALDIVRLSKKRRKSPATQHRGHGASTGASSFFGFPKPWASMSFFACKRKQGAQGKAGHTVPCSRNRCCIALFGVSVLSRGPNEILRTSRHAPHPRCLCGNTRWSCHPAAVQPKAIKTHLNFFFGTSYASEARRSSCTPAFRRSHSLCLPCPAIWNEEQFPRQLGLLLNTSQYSSCRN